MRAQAVDVSLNGAQFAAISSLRTGSIIFDMLVALLVPLVFRFLFDGDAQSIVSWLKTFLRKRGNIECIRTISHLSRGNRGAFIAENKNDLLQKALTLYMTDVIRVRFSGKASVSLTSVVDDRQHQWERPDKYNPLAGHRLTWIAPENEWVCVDEHLEFRHSQHDVGSEAKQDGDGKGKLKVFELRCNAPGGSDHIDAFLDTTVAWYKQQLQEMKDDSRYMYSMSVCDGFTFKKADEESVQKYKRYKLSDHKTFGSLFFPEKDGLLELLQSFLKKQGRFGIPGYPHKLGLLLHGPPGTGKTSLIKALAQYTNRSIINIPLATIKTNSELMDVMYDLKLSVQNVEQPVQLAFKDVIFVIEDVDAASKVVLRRDGCYEPCVRTTAADGMESPLNGDGSESEDASLTSSVETLVQDALKGKSACITPSEPDVSSDGKGITMGPRPPSVLDAIDSLIKPKTDALNLAGVLNVLDGVVDTPERIVVMTSNFPERLDPALIRPGRIDRQLFLGYLQTQQAMDMIQHYLSVKLSDGQSKRLSALLSALNQHSRPLTPAQMEQLCSVHNTIDGLLEALECQLCGLAADKMDAN